MADRAEAPRRPSLPRGLSILLGLASALVVVVLLPQVAWLVAPVALSLVIVICLSPVLGWTRRRGVPAPLSVALFVVVSYAVILFLAAVLVVSVAQLVSLLPGYSAELRAVLGTVLDRLAALGVSAPSRQALLSAFSLDRLSSFGLALLGRVSDLAVNVTFLLSLLFFLAVEAVEGGARLASVRTRPRLVAALRDFAANTRRFMVVTTVFGLITAVVDTALLVALDIPLAVLWGLLAVATNYVPYVGFVIGVVPPALLGLLEGGWQTALLVVVVYVVVNTVLNSFVQPFFLGDAVGLSLTVTFLVVVFWGWALGPLGAILAIPLTLLVKAVLVDSDPGADWARAVLGSKGQYAPAGPGSTRRPDRVRAARGAPPRRTR